MEIRPSVRDTAPEVFLNTVTLQRECRSCESEIWKVVRWECQRIMAYSSMEL